MKNVIVVGAGAAGLAAAIRLQNAGYHVTLYEKEQQVGGKMNQIQKGGYTFDVGPSIVMMPQEYREVFELCGRNADDYIPMQRIEPMLDLSFPDSGPLAFSSDLVTLTSILESVDKDDAEGYLEYLAIIYKRFNIARDHFLSRSFRTASDFYNPKSLYEGFRLHTFGDAYSTISHYVKDERLRQALAFQTLYIGISPYEGPSLYSMIPMIELLYGVWFIKGGMYTMAEGMKKLFLELGGTLHTGRAVERIYIEEGRAQGVIVGDRLIKTDYVVCNADFPYAMKNLVKDERAKGKYTDAKIESMDYSCSCFVLYLGVDKQYPLNAVHTIRFSHDFQENVADIFQNKTFPTDPSFYIHAPSMADPSMAPEGKQALYVLTPVSPLVEGSPAWTLEETTAFREKILDLLEAQPGFSDIRSHIEVEEIFTPLDFEHHFNAYKGATFGLRPTLKQSNYWRPHNKADDCEALYFCGSSVHPGAGVPIVLMGAKLAVEELMRDDQPE